MSDQSERLHLEGLDEATERERWEEHYGPPPARSRAEAEKAIVESLFKHQPRSVAYQTGWEAQCSGCDWVGAGFVQNVSSVTNIHRAHVASVLADLMAEGDR